MTASENMLSKADKDAICDFIYASVGRVLDRSIVIWNRPIPQGVSVFKAHPDTQSYEYMFTKDDKYPVRQDDRKDVISTIRNYTDVTRGGLILYMNSCMQPIASKHEKFAY